MSRLTATAVAAAVIASAGAAHAETSTAWPGYVVKPFRFDEDYSAIAARPGPKPLLLRLKAAPLPGDPKGYVSLGGEYRLRFDADHHPDFGLRGAPAFTSTQQRFELHADVHLSPTVRAFVQVAAGTEAGRWPGPRPGDRGAPDIAQAFVDLKTAAGVDAWRLRLGRQELAFGKYVAVRDITNLRRTFDGVRLDGPAAGWTVSLVAARPTRQAPRRLDDPDTADSLIAAFADHGVGSTGFRVGLSALRRQDRGARFVEGVGVERRDTLGVRLYGRMGAFDIDGQVSRQTGRFTPNGLRPLRIDAWGAAFEGGWTWRGPWSPRLALRYDGAGGDRRSGDGKLETFDLPYPNLSYLTDAAIFAPRNVHDLQPFVTVSPSPAVTLTVGAQWLWRNSTADAVYSPIGTPVLRPGGSAHAVATEPYLRLTWRITPLTELQAAAVRALPQAALKQAGGRRDLSYGLFSIAQRF